ncbi:uncharacterized protein QC761_124430 [Podospora bellae-mahoneyi]|uniref:NACHT-NTPase and P-loop NTPases N-terminal domain-containing protein n=1 Tax=Podospora bellae-mahoneyi TaxID=2093777 RepID=A0ABR0FV13_9PEZI|nr:hypothetical protein QC761_124430 [Podospora bellae-mahoneyi]
MVVHINDNESRTGRQQMTRRRNLRQAKMADIIGTIVTLVETVQSAVTLYQRIDGLPTQMTQLGKRIERLSPFLSRLESFIKKRPAAASSSLYPGQKQDLRQLLDAINDHIKKATDLFERYEKGILSRSHDLEFRARWVSQIWFSLVENSPEKVQAILDDIEYDRGVLSDYLALMAVDKQPDIPSPNLITSPAPKKIIINSPANKNIADSPKKNNLSPSSAPAKRPSPSPSPIPRQDLKILFVDPYHAERTAIAESLLALFRELTLLYRSNTPWRISAVSSAGFFVKNSSDLVPVISSLNYSYPSWKKDFKPGGPGDVPKPEALKAIFDNNWANYPFKNAIKSQISTRPSVGLTKDVFEKYDYIIVFTKREHDNMVKLKEAVTAMTKERQRARVLHLGVYLGGEIVYPTLAKGAGEVIEQTNRHEWNKKVAQIKTALKEFLRQEMRWQMPELPGPEKNDGKQIKDTGEKDANGFKNKKKESGKDKVNAAGKAKGKGS